jgi:acetoin utilization protein AcuB
VTIKLQEGRGVLARLTHELSQRGANIVSLGTFWGDDPTNREIAFKVQGIDHAELEAIIEDLDAELVDIRDT